MRVEFTSSVGDGYAIAKEGESAIYAVGRSIARREGYHYRGARLDSWAPNGETHRYEITITERSPRYSGDAVPFRNVWVTVY